MHLHYGVKYENLGYHIDFHVDNKYYGSIKIDKPDREIIGYSGKQNHVALEDIVFKNKRIKKGMKYHTYLYPLCGKSNFNVKDLAKINNK
ncbi:MAG: hypothetical protein ABF265_08200 [Polaribacter sp.]